MERRIYMKEFNVSKGFENYSQRNNVICPNSSCGPTNFIQGLEYSGWQWDDSMFPNLKQPEDKLTKFCRTNKDVLNYYSTKYNAMYKNWMAEAKELAKETGKEYWEVDCVKNYPPNEVHDVMNYAVNLFIGYKANDISKDRPVCNFYNHFKESEVISSILNGLPVISSVDPFKKGAGHYITIVGFRADVDINEFSNPECIKEYIIDNTYGKFDFVNKKYIAVSGNDEYIERTKLLDIVKPVSHFFKKGAAVCC
jgi:hypothetical protein